MKVKIITNLNIVREYNYIFEIFYKENMLNMRGYVMPTFDTMCVKVKLDEIARMEIKD